MNNRRVYCGMTEPFASQDILWESWWRSQESLWRTTVTFSPQTLERPFEQYAVPSYPQGRLHKWRSGFSWPIWRCARRLCRLPWISKTGWWFWGWTWAAWKTLYPLLEIFSLNIKSVRNVLKIPNLKICLLVILLMFGDILCRSDSLVDIFI